MGAMSDFFDKATMTLADAAVILNISRNTAYRQAQNGQLAGGVPVLRVGSRYVVPTEPLLRAITTPDDEAELRHCVTALAAEVLDAAGQQLHVLANLLRGEGARALVEQAGLLPAGEPAHRRTERDEHRHAS